MGGDQHVVASASWMNPVNDLFIAEQLNSWALQTKLGGFPKSIPWLVVNDG